MYIEADLKELDALIEKLENAGRTPYRFYRDVSHELAARLLELVIMKTPTGDYPISSGRKGGTLKRGWTAKSHKQAAGGSGEPTPSQARSFAYKLPINHKGSIYQITVSNPVEYASYVEFGHRTRRGNGAKTNSGNGNKKRGWVDGKYMLTISEEELKHEQRAIIEEKIEEWLEVVFDDK